MTHLPSRSRVPLRVLAGSAAASGLLLHVLNISFLIWLWGGGRPDLLGLETRLLVPAGVQALAWGVGFAVLALVMIWRVEHRHEVLMAALFLGVYSLWGGFLSGFRLLEDPWPPALLVACDVLAHAAGIRFTQLFPRPLRAEHLTGLGPRWLRRTVMPAFAVLLNPRVYWPAAVAFEAVIRILPWAGVNGLHVLVWCVLATTYVYASFRRSTREERQRIFWILEGVVVFLLAQIIWVGLWAVDASGVVSVDLRVWSSWLNAVSACATLVCFALAIFYSGAFDSELVLRRTAVLSVASVGALLIFVTLETATEEILGHLLGLESRLGAIVGGLMAALAFRPLSVKLEAYAERWSETSRAVEEPEPPVAASGRV